MGRTVSAADANRDFSKLLREVRNGDWVIITSHGKPVAKIVPFVVKDSVRDAAYATLLTQLRSQPAIDIGRWTRDELYEND